MPEKRYTKVEEEILQILDKMEVVDERPAQSPLRAVPSPPRRKPRSHRMRSFLHAPWTSLALTAAFAFAALLARDTSHLLATALASLSIIAFFAPIVLRRQTVSPGGVPQHFGTKQWRGRDISFDPPHRTSLAERARIWLDNQRRNRRRDD